MGCRKNLSTDICLASLSNTLVSGDYFNSIVTYNSGDQSGGLPSGSIGCGRVPVRSQLPLVVCQSIDLL